jgi:hypothetical protein
MPPIRRVGAVCLSLTGIILDLFWRIPFFDLRFYGVRNDGLIHFFDMPSLRYLRFELVPSWLKRARVEPRG